MTKKTIPTYQGDNKAQINLFATKLKARGGACRIEPAEDFEKCKCMEAANDNPNQPD